MKGRTKKADTFLVKIMDHEHATWQGKVTWIEGQAIEKTIEKTTKELILNMHKYGLSLEKIADIVKKDISEVQEIISNS